MDAAAQTLGRIFAIAMDIMDPISNVPKEFREHLAIMGKKAADALPSHKEYNCNI